MTKIIKILQLMIILLIIINTYDEELDGIAADTEMWAPFLSFTVMVALLKKRKKHTMKPQMKISEK